MGSDNRGKIIKKGHPCEATWLSDLGEVGKNREEGLIGNDGKFKDYFKEMERHYVRPEPVAPMVMLDSIKPRYHQGACRTIESKKEWEMENKAHNLIDFGSAEEARPKRDEQAERKKKREEYRKASKAAIETVRSNPREVRNELEKQVEAQIETLRKSGINLDNAILTQKGK